MNIVKTSVRIEQHEGEARVVLDEVAIDDRTVGLGIPRDLLGRLAVGEGPLAVTIHVEERSALIDPTPLPEGRPVTLGFALLALLGLRHDPVRARLLPIDFG